MQKRLYVIIFIYKRKYFFESQCEKMVRISATQILREIKFPANVKFKRVVIKTAWFFFFFKDSNMLKLISRKI